MPSAPIGTKPEGLVYPSPRLPLRSCGYLGFRTPPPLNPVGLSMPSPAVLRPSRLTAWPASGLEDPPRKSTPNQELFGCTSILLFHCADHPKPVRSTPRFIPRIDPPRRQPHSDHAARPGLENRLQNTPQTIVVQLFEARFNTPTPAPRRFQPPPVHPKNPRPPQKSPCTAYAPPIRCTRVACAHHGHHN